MALCTTVKNQLLAVLAVTMGLGTLPGSLYAHHSDAVYDRTRRVTLKGTVTEFTVVNPHTQIHFRVKDERGNVEQWTAESGPPRRLYRVGWNAKTLKPGDEITVTGAPAKDGRKVMSNRRLVAPNGQVLREGAD